MPPVTMDDFNEYLSTYVGDQARLALLLDYDGNLLFNIIINRILLYIQSEKYLRIISFISIFQGR